MMESMEHFSAKGQYLQDVAYGDGAYFATGEFKKTKFGYMGFVVISGPGSTQSTVLHHVGQIAISDESEALARVAAYVEIMLAFLKTGDLLDGFALRELAIDGRDVIQTAKAHLAYHSSNEHFGGPGTALHRKTLRQFGLLAQFGIPKPVRLLAEMEGVPVTTISRRLATARQKS
jgi:hypothetical protein